MVNQEFYFLLCRVGELGRRWSVLQNMMMGIQDKWDRSGDSVMARLQEKLAWAATKRAQLEAVVVGQSLTQVKRQAEEHRELRCAEYYVDPHCPVIYWRQRCSYIEFQHIECHVMIAVPVIAECLGVESGASVTHHTLQQY